MKHGSEKSDARVVAAKSANKSEKSEAESMEPRRATKENMDQTPKSRTQCREIEVSGLERVRQRSKSQPKERMTTLMHHLTVEALWSAYDRLKRNAAPGVDGVTWQEYGEDLIVRLTELHQRLQSNRYQPQPSRRVYIAKADGRQRPLGIAALEDKIVQGAVVDVLNAIYEPAFKGYSHGFRPGRNPHQALDALAYGIRCRPVNWIIDADIACFFDTVNHDWLQRFLEHRIADRRLLRLIKLWLEAGVLEAGRIIVSEEGTPQGAVISPVLANIYLHYVFDLWADRWRQRNARGQVILVRYADDIVIGFEHEWEAHRFLVELRERMESFSLKLHSEKTRLLEFGRHAMARRARNGQGKTRDIQLSGIHAHLRTQPAGKLPADTPDAARPDAGQAPGTENGVEEADAPPHPGGGKMARPSGSRVLPVPRCADQRPPAVGIPLLCGAAVVANAETSQSTRWLQFEATRPSGDRLAATGSYPSPLAGGTLCRQSSKVGARCPNWARRDLCGGCPVMDIPTAIECPRSFLSEREIQMRFRSPRTAPFSRK